MNGYSKMRVSSRSSRRYTTKARSVDFSDPTTHAYDFPSHPPQAQGDPNPSPKDDKNVVTIVGGGGGERFGAALRRNFSSSGSQRFRPSYDHRISSSSSSTTFAFGAVVRRAFSMRKAASVAEGYWRMDGSGEDGDLMEEEEQQEEEQEEAQEGGEGEQQQQQQVQMRFQSRKKKKKKNNNNNNRKNGSIFRACKRLFGL